MKPKRSCEACRQRHRRCIKPPQAIACNACLELGRDCELGLSPSLQILAWKAKPADGSPAASAASAASVASAASHSPQAGAAAASPGAQTQTTVSHPSPLGHRRESIPAPHNDIDQSPASGLLSRREAFLFRTWVEKISLMSDATDDARHFAVTVSRLALEHPVLLNGILGLVSRLDSLATGAPDLESVLYHGRCIELLITLLSEPVETYDDILLAAVVLSRLYEENDSETDSLTYHLTGTRTLLGHQVITRLAAQGGLAEAACWVHLRQALYVAIVHRQHPTIPLSVYESLTAFRKDDDTSCGNRIVYLFARIILQYFPGLHSDESSATTQSHSWAVLRQDLEAWFRTRPISFEPIYHKAPNIDGGEPFPCIWMASTAAGGYLLQEPRERTHTIQYLELVDRRIQWKTGPIIAALKDQWAELDGNAGSGG